VQTHSDHQPVSTSPQAPRSDRGFTDAKWRQNRQRGVSAKVARPLVVDCEAQCRPNGLEVN
jgi:hypothetical protein